MHYSTNHITAPPTISRTITHDPHQLLNNGRQTQKLVYWMSGREARCDVLKAIKVQYIDYNVKLANINLSKT